MLTYGPIVVISGPVVVVGIGLYKLQLNLTVGSVVVVVVVVYRLNLI